MYTSKLLNKFLKNIKNKARFTSYVKTKKIEVQKDLLLNDIEVWNQDVYNQNLYNAIINDFIESIIDWYENNYSESLATKDAVLIHTYFYKIYRVFISLCNELDIDDSELINFIASDKTNLEFGRLLGIISIIDYNNFWDTYFTIKDKVPSLKKKLEYSDLKQFYSKPEYASLIICLGAVRTLNNLFISNIRTNRIIAIDDKSFTTDLDEHFTLLLPIKPLKFNKKFTIDYKEVLSKLYDKLTSGVIHFIDKELTNKNDFIEIFTTKNINLIDGEIFFNVDRYQMAYILSSKLGFYFKHGFIETMVESEKFIKKPFGDSPLTPITLRDFQDYKSKYNGGIDKKTKKPLKNALIINAIFLEH